MWGVENGNLKDASASAERRIRRVWRFWAALWSGFLLALAHVPSAYADGDYQPTLAGVVQGPTPYASYGDDEYYDGYLVYGANKYDCLIYALGLNPNDFDLVARAKLSSPSKGGKFYEVVQEGYNDRCPAWVSIPFYEGWLYQSGTTPGSGQNPQYLWAFEIYEDDFEQAKEDAETIRDGGSIDDGGGGGGGGDVGGEGYVEIVDKNTIHGVLKPMPIDNYKIITLEGVQYRIYNNRAAYNASTYENKRLCDTVDVTISGTSSSIDFTKLYENVYLCLPIGTNNTIYVRSFEEKLEKVTSNITINGTEYERYTLKNATGATVKGYYLQTSSITQVAASFDDDILVLHFTYSSSTLTTNNLSNNSTAGSPNANTAWISGDSDEGTGGEEQPDDPSPDPSPDPWPDPVTPTPKPNDPVVPTPPSPSTPTEPDVPLPGAPDWPLDPGFPYEPDVTLPTVEDDNDFTVDLSGILDALNEHCIHLQNCMIECTSIIREALYDIANTGNRFLYRCLGNEMVTTRYYLRSLAEYIVDNLSQGIYDGFTAVTENQADILNYFQSFASWLSDKLNFQFPKYDDTSLIYWLKRIYYQKGTGTDSRPVDPVTDPFGIGEWLTNLANNLIQALEGLAPGLVGDLLSTIDLLKLKFPFSLPWDMMAILGAFVASPEAPNVDFPCYAYTASGLEQVGTYEIDLDAYSQVMEGVRFVGYLGFMAYTLSLMPKWAETLCEVVGCA